MKAAFVALTLLAAPAAAVEKPLPPVTPIAGPPTPLADATLDVQRLQARMAKGDRSAYDEQRARLKTLGAAIAAAKADAFKVRAERDAVLVYLLSGGQPRDVATLLARGDFPAPERDLLVGAAGYAAGRQAEAEKLLPYDPRRESLRLGGQLAYAQSVLLTPRDARKALDLLDLARLLSPGALIEEAALRRQILLVGDLRDAARVAFLARQYVQRYGASLYAGDFVRSLAAAAVRFDLCATAADLDKFAALFALAPPEQARAFLLTVARASLPLGRFEVAVKAAENVHASPGRSADDEARARLYALLASFPALTAPQADAAFAAVKPESLAPDDRPLFAAALAVRARLYDPPPATAFAEPWREAGIAAARSPDLGLTDLDAPAATIRRASAALAAAQALGQAPR